jgi:hypothetical protein
LISTAGRYRHGCPVWALTTWITALLWKLSVAPTTWITALLWKLSVGPDDMVSN